MNGNAYIIWHKVLGGFPSSFSGRIYSVLTRLVDVHEYPTALGVRNSMLTEQGQSSSLASNARAVMRKGIRAITFCSSSKLACNTRLNPLSARFVIDTVTSR
jgi:hypothetical protein